MVGHCNIFPDEFVNSVQTREEMLKRSNYVDNAYHSAKMQYNYFKAQVYNLDANGDDQMRSVPVCAVFNEHHLQ